jgi:hypothetical protein
MDPHPLRSGHRLVSVKATRMVRVLISAGGVTDGYRSAYAIAAHFPKPDMIPSVHADFGPYLSFDLNYAATWAITTELYYLILTPAMTVSRDAHTHNHGTNEKN